LGEALLDEALLGKALEALRIAAGVGALAGRAIGSTPVSAINASPKVRIDCICIYL
jgi:hypothetical protein